MFATSPGLKVRKYEFFIFESETVLKFYNLCACIWEFKNDKYQVIQAKIYLYEASDNKMCHSLVAKSQDCAIPDTSMKLSTLVKAGELMIFRHRTTSTNFLCSCARQNSLPL